MGPWIHGGWARTDGSTLGDVRFDSNTAKFYQEQIEFPFFQQTLKDKMLDVKLPEAYVFETAGTSGTRWRSGRPRMRSP